MSDPYRTAPPAEWPRSLRAAYTLGRAVGAAMPLPLFFGIILGFGLMGAGLGFGAAHDMYARERKPDLAPTCNVRSDWDGNEPVHYGFALLRDDEKIGRFDSVDAAIAVAEKLGCKIKP